MKVRTLIPIVSLVIGVVWIIYGLSHHGFWHHARGPMPGFVPSLIAGVLVLTSIIGIFQSRKETESPDRKENWTIVLAAAITFSLVFVFGMHISLLLFVFVWLKFYEKMNWRNTIIVLIISFCISYGVFVLWLGVPFPRGIILDAIIG